MSQEINGTDKNTSEQLVEITKMIINKQEDFTKLVDDKDFEKATEVSRELSQLTEKAAEIKAAIQKEEITKEDVAALRDIEPKRKAVPNMLETEVAQTPKFEKMLEKEFGEKSPYEMRRRNLAWREDETSIVPIVEMTSFEIPEKITDIRKSEYLKQIERGMFFNQDTGIEISFGRKAVDEIIAKAIPDAKRNRPIEGRLAAIHNMAELIKDSICFDSEISDYDPVNSKNKSPNTLFMHKFYSVFSYQSTYFLACLSVEEMYSRNERDHNKLGSTSNRLYSLKDIKITPTELGLDTHDLMPVGISSVPIGVITIISISQLYTIVKKYDKNFYENKQSPGRAEREAEITAQQKFEQSVKKLNEHNASLDRNNSTSALSRQKSNKGVKKSMNQEQIDRLMKNLAYFYAEEFLPADYLKNELVYEPFNERLFCNILKDLSDNLTMENAGTREGRQIATMASDLMTLMNERCGTPRFDYSDLKDSFTERNVIESFTSNVISNIDNLNNKDIRRAYNYSAECKEQNGVKDVMFSQYIDGQKENILNVNYNKANTEMAVDVKTIPQRLSEIAMTSFEKVNKLVNSITTAAEKSLQIAKSRISVKFPKGFQLEADKIPANAIQPMMDRYYIDPQAMNINDLTNLFARSQKHNADISRKSNIQYDFGNAKEIIRDAVQSLSRDDNNITPIQVYMTKTSSYPNQLNGNGNNGSLCIEIHDEKMGSFKAYVPMLEAESIGLMSKMAEVDRTIPMNKADMAVLQHESFQMAVMELAHLVGASIHAVPNPDNPQSYMINKGEKGFIGNIKSPRELLSQLTYGERPTEPLMKVSGKAEAMMAVCYQQVNMAIEEMEGLASIAAKTAAIEANKIEQCKDVIADIVKLTEADIRPSTTGNDYTVLKGDELPEFINTPSEMVKALLRNEVPTTNLNDLVVELRELIHGDFKSLNDMMTIDDLYKGIKEKDTTTPPGSHE